VATDERRSPEDFLVDVLADAASYMLGVYEVLWMANTWWPDWPLSRRLRTAEETVASLVRSGLVRLYRGDWETAEDNPIRAEETQTVLRDWETWAIPDGPHVFLLATDEGKSQIQRAPAPHEQARQPIRRKPGPR
jgi:hypothetical protein